MAAAVTGKSEDAAAQDFRRMCERHPDVNAFCTDVKFPDSRGRRGQKATPVTDVRGIVEIVMLLPGSRAARVRCEAAGLLVRYLGGDRKIVDEVRAMHGFQQHMAAERPDDPRRIFAEAAGGGAGSSGASPSAGPSQEQLARVFSDVMNT